MKTTIVNRIHIKRTNVKLHPDRTRVLARPFRLMSDHRSIKICARVMTLPESEVHALLEQVRAEFGERHLKIDEFLRRQFDEVRLSLLPGQELSEERELLLGAYFTHEYSLEAAALFNPSIVPHPDQFPRSPSAPDSWTPMTTSRLIRPLVTAWSRHKCQMRRMRNACSSGSCRNSV